VLTSFNRKQRNESEDAPEKCALWNVSDRPLCPSATLIDLFLAFCSTS
jgi:hypothetical protein